MIAQGTLLIDIERKKVGQVNGLAVLDLGGYAFGRPSRVMIPAANVRNLILRADVVHAGDKGEFHIYPVLTIDEGIGVLTGRKAGEMDEAGLLDM